MMIFLRLFCLLVPAYALFMNKKGNEEIVVKTSPLSLTTPLCAETVGGGVLCTILEKSQKFSKTFRPFNKHPNPISYQYYDENWRDDHAPEYYDNVYEDPDWKPEETLWYTKQKHRVAKVGRHGRGYMELKGTAAAMGNWRSHQSVPLINDWSPKLYKQNLADVILLYPVNNNKKQHNSKLKQKQPVSMDYYDETNSHIDRNNDDIDEVTGLETNNDSLESGNQVHRMDDRSPKLYKQNVADMIWLHSLNNNKMQYNSKSIQKPQGFSMDYYDGTNIRIARNANDIDEVTDLETNGDSLDSEIKTKPDHINLAKGKHRLKHNKKKTLSNNRLTKLTKVPLVKDRSPKPHKQNLADMIWLCSLNNNKRLHNFKSKPKQLSLAMDYYDGTDFRISGVPGLETNSDSLEYGNQVHRMDDRSPKLYKHNLADMIWLDSLNNNKKIHNSESKQKKPGVSMDYYDETAVRIDGNDDVVNEVTDLEARLKSGKKSKPNQVPPKKEKNSKLHKLLADLNWLYPLNNNQIIYNSNSKLKPLGFSMDYYNDAAFRIAKDDDYVNEVADLETNGDRLESEKNAKTNKVPPKKKRNPELYKQNLADMIWWYPLNNSKKQYNSKLKPRQLGFSMDYFDGINLRIAKNKYDVDEVTDLEINDDSLESEKKAKSTQINLAEGKHRLRSNKNKTLSNNRMTKLAKVSRTNDRSPKLYKQNLGDMNWLYPLNYNKRKYNSKSKHKQPVSMDYYDGSDRIDANNNDVDEVIDLETNSDSLESEKAKQTQINLAKGKHRLGPNKKNSLSNNRLTKMPFRSNWNGIFNSEIYNRPLQVKNEYSKLGRDSYEPVNTVALEDESEEKARNVKLFNIPNEEEPVPKLHQGQKCLLAKKINEDDKTQVKLQILCLMTSKVEPPKKAKGIQQFLIHKKHNKPRKPVNNRVFSSKIVSPWLTQDDEEKERFGHKPWANYRPRMKQFSASSEEVVHLVPPLLIQDDEEKERFGHKPWANYRPRIKQFSASSEEVVHFVPPMLTQDDEEKERFGHKPWANYKPRMKQFSASSEEVVHLNQKMFSPNKVLYLFPVE